MTQNFDGLELGPAAEKLGIVLTSLSPQAARATMPVAGNTQPLGLLHGGASALLAETVASAACFRWAQTLGDFIAVGTQLTIQHLRAAASGLVEAQATALHLGKRTAVYRFDITSAGEEKLIAAGEVSLQILPRA